ncbi:hydroxyacylglutathione hydrolase [uncultured Ferrovibrio sp.]|jgi:hydroxyacylglutathione hydrolase|uniref:hydroxyacylglutathione hydrolase n=1 Tax=uncultured Ferrovibrio sp. TaxID=1576913 RepID=UPI00261993C0|nr:hydroxyacylglutathione hydrolase [uncultured Ferrovibrio sp.]
MPLDIVQIPVLNDNYVYLARDPATNAVGAVDPAVHEPVLAELSKRGWTLTHILNTHHHPDHVGGNMALKEATGCQIVGPKADAERIPGIDVALADGDRWSLGSEEAVIFDVPGHTRGHIAFWFEKSDALFCGDTLFALGCGRLFEGTPAQMWTSLSKFLKLPDSTRVYCAHEYTESNARFAVTVEPGNETLQLRYKKIRELREKGLPTVPSTIGDERATNPFLRPMSENLRMTLGLQHADDVAVFAETRRRKDSFRG